MSFADQKCFVALSIRDFNSTTSEVTIRHYKVTCLNLIHECHFLLKYLNKLFFNVSNINILGSKKRKR